VDVGQRTGHPLLSGVVVPRQNVAAWNLLGSLVFFFFISDGFSGVPICSGTDWFIKKSALNSNMLANNNMIQQYALLSSETISF